MEMRLQVKPAASPKLVVYTSLNALFRSGFIQNFQVHYSKWIFVSVNLLTLILGV